MEHIKLMFAPALCMPIMKAGIIKCPRVSSRFLGKEWFLNLVTIRNRINQRILLTLPPRSQEEKWRVWLYYEQHCYLRYFNQQFFRDQSRNIGKVFCRFFGRDPSRELDKGIVKDFLKYLVEDSTSLKEDFKFYLKNNQRKDFKRWIKTKKCFRTIPSGFMARWSIRKNIRKEY